MAGKLIGHRKSGEDRWEWSCQPQQRRWGWVRRSAALGAVVLAAVVVLTLSLIQCSDGGWSLGDRIRFGSTAVSTPTPGESSPSVEGVGPAGTPAPEGAMFQLAVWSDREGEWRFTDLQPEESNYQEGQAVPFLLRIDGAETGRIYRLVLCYPCSADGRTGFDFLAGYERGRGSGPALAQHGPGRERPDAAIPIPDDPSIAFDDQGGERLFRLWGGTFEMVPLGPGEEMPGQGEKRIVLSVRASAKTVFLLWGGHLRSAEDWGEAQGAASQQDAVLMSVEVDGAVVVVHRVGLLPGAIGG